MEMSSNRKCDMSCDPANPRRLPVSGLEGEKSATEDSTWVGTQAPVTVNATGQNKRYVQQAFHPSLLQRPRSASVGSASHATNRELRDPQHSTSNYETPPSISTNTDVEIIEDSPIKPTSPTNNEKEWMQTTNKKRQRSSPEPLKSQKQSKLDTYWLSQPTPISTSNSFAVLENEQLQETNKPPIFKPKADKPPPIFVDRVNNIQPLIELMETYAYNNYDLKVLRNDQVKIQTKSSETYTVVVKELEKKKTEFYTYKQKQDRSFKVVLKNIHPSTSIDDIKDALDDLDHECTNIWNIKQRTTKKALPMFIVELKQKGNNKTVFDIKYLLHCKVVVEPPRPKREIPQCGNCLQYGHTKTYCKRSPKCIKCAGDHLSADCPRKTRSDSVKCVLCEGNHPANYKGCKVYRELQKIKFPPASAQVQKYRRSYDRTKQSNNPSTTAMTYAEVVQDKTPHQANEPNNKTNNDQICDIKELMITMKQMMEQLTAMTNLILNLTTKLTSHWTP